MLPHFLKQVPSFSDKGKIQNIFIFLKKGKLDFLK